MRISSVEVFVHERAWQLTSGFGVVPDNLMPMGVLTIGTDEGVAGHAFVSGPGPGARRPCRDIIDSLRPLLLGRNPLDIGAIWGSLWPLVPVVDPIAVGAVDVALWDLAGTVAGLPVHRLLGTCSDHMPAYVSSWVRRTPDDYAREVAHHRAAGWPGYKLHPPTQLRKLGHEVATVVDIETCEAVRDAAGDDMVLMLDSACAYDLGGAIKVGQAIEKLGYG